MYVKDCRVRQIGCTEEPVTCTNNLNTAFPAPSSIKFAAAESRACGNSPAYRDGVWVVILLFIKREWQEARGVGIGIAGDAALEEISRVHRFVRVAAGKAAACRTHALSTPLRRSQARSCGNVLSCRSFAPQQVVSDSLPLRDVMRDVTASQTLIPTMYSDYDEDDEELQQYLDEERRYHDEDQNDEQEHQNDPQPPQPVANFQPQLPLLLQAKNVAQMHAPAHQSYYLCPRKSEFAEVLDAVFVAVGWNEQTLGFKIVGEALRTNRFSPTQDGPQDGPGWCQSSRKQRKDGRRDLNTFDLDLICEVPRSFNGQHFETRDLDGGPSSGPVFFWKWIALIILNNFIT
ncbi:hypothetical protein B0H13DRAFT_1921056 [Mycena leptocephala]|nr:hypothetical protein B0H13DRAFT_1921056 [Mycena leptocephala]